MFNQYSYRFKFKFLIFFFVILSIAAYRRSFGNLITLFNEHRELNAKKEKISSQKPNVNTLKNQIASLDKLIGKEGVEKEKIQQEIIDFLVTNGSEISIYDLQPIHELIQEDYKIYTFQLDLIGNYNRLLSLTNNFEKQFEFSKIVSLKFYKDKKNNKADVLHLKLIFQNYENNK